MKRQLGNSIRMEWTILRNGQVEDFSLAQDIKIVAFIPNLSSDRIEVPISRLNNVFHIDIEGDLLSIGKYTLHLTYKVPNPAFESGFEMVSTAVKDAFQILTLGSLEGSLEDDINITSNVIYCLDGATFIPTLTESATEVIISWTNNRGLPNPDPVNIRGTDGKSAFEIWKEFIGQPTATEQDFFDYLQEPAIVAADLATAAANLANSAASAANTAALAANDAADDANAAAASATSAASAANSAASSANTAASNANAATTAANTAATNAQNVADTYATTLANKIDKSSITPDFGSDNTKVISQKGYTDDMKAWLPSSVYSDRVTADSGSIRNRALLFDSYKSILDLSANTLLQYSPEMGLKQSVSGVVYKATNLYDMSANNNDAAQATAGSQPYVVNNVAPNEKSALWGLSKTLPFTAITLNTTDKWSIVLVSEQLGGASDFIGSTNTRITTSAVNDSITFKNESGTSVSLNITKIIGKTNRITLVAKGDGTLQVWINGLLQGVISNPTNITLNSLYFNANSKVKAVRVLNKDLSKSEIENIDNFLKIAYPDIDGTAIGSQYWATSNAMISVTGDGPAIAEVPSNDAATNPELITNAADREFSSDTGFWNKTAQVTIGGGVCNIKSTDGSVQSLGRAFLTQGKTYKVQLDIIANRGGSLRLQSVSEQILFDSTIGTKTIYIRADGSAFNIIRQTSPTDIDIDNISAKECGWADAQAIYDYYISVGKSVLEATKAAAMFCKYNNSDDNAAVYGYLYNWWAAYLLSINSPKGLRYPTELDTDQLRTTLGGSSIAGGKLKKEGTAYFNSPNTGASNESGFTAIGGGTRLPAGGFASIKDEQYHWVMPESSSTLGKCIVIRANSAGLGATATSSKRYGMYVRFLKNAPVGEQFEEVTSGVFSTNIATAQKELSVKLGYTIESVKVSSANALTNFKVEMRSASGTLLQTLMTGKNVPSGNIPTEFKCLVDMPIQLQDYKLWVTAVGNSGDGMEIKVMTKKILF